MIGGRLAHELRGFWRSLQYDLIRATRRVRHSRFGRVPVVGAVLALIVIGGAGVTAAAFQLRPEMPAPTEATVTVMPPMQVPTATEYVTITPAPSLVPTIVPTTVTATSRWMTTVTSGPMYVRGPTQVETHVQTHPGPTVTATRTVSGPTIYVTETATPSSDPTTPTPDDDESDGEG